MPAPTIDDVFARSLRIPNRWHAWCRHCPEWETTHPTPTMRDTACRMHWLEKHATRDNLTLGEPQ